MDSNEIRLLHIHAQPHEHGEAFIVGNKAGLKALHDAITGALAGAPPDQAIAEVMANDGEGYSVYVVRLSEDWSDGYWKHCVYPYTDDAYDRNPDKTAKSPYDLVDWEKVKARNKAKAAARKAARTTGVREIEQRREREAARKNAG